MINQDTYDLLKRLHEFPFGKDGEELEYGRFEAKYWAIYGDINKIGERLSQLKSLGYMDIPENSIGVKILFTQKGFDVVREYENAIIEGNLRAQLEEDNLKLQNEQLRYQNRIRDKEAEISNLTKENLNLQIKQLKNKLSYSIIGVVTGFILANWKDILIMLQIIDK